MFIRIIATPAGIAPEEVRREWVGLELPLAKGETGPRVVSMRPQALFSRARKVNGYVVDSAQAVAILDKKAPWAAWWWREEAPFLAKPGPGKKWVFGADECSAVAADPATLANQATDPTTVPAQVEDAKNHAIFFTFSLALAGFTIVAGLLFIVQGLLRLSDQPGQFWGWLGAGLGCIWGGVCNIRGTRSSFRQVEGARELLLEAMFGADMRHRQREEIRRLQREPGGLKHAWTTVIGANAAQTREPDWRAANRAAIIGALVFLPLAFGGFAVTVWATWTFLGWGGWWLLLLIPLYVPMLVLAVGAFGSLLVTVTYPAARLLLHRGADREDTAEKMSPPGAASLPRGVGPKMMVLSVGSVVGSFLMLLGAWRASGNVDLAGAFWAGLAVGVAAILGAWPALLGRRNQSKPDEKPKSLLRSLRDAIFGTATKGRQWKGWQTVMEDPGWNWFDVATVGWLAVGIVAAILPFTLPIAMSPAIKNSWHQLVLVFLLQGILFVFARFYVRKAVLLQQKGKDMAGSRVRSQFASVFAMVALIVLIAFWMYSPLIPTLPLVRKFACPEVHALAISPDGRFALTGHEDGGVRLLDLETSAEVRRFGGGSHLAPYWWVNSVIFTPDGKLALSGSGEDVRVSDLNTGKVVRLLEGEGQVFAVSPDGDLVLTGFQRSQALSHQGPTPLVLRKLATGDVVHRFEGASAAAFIEGGTDAAFSPDGRQVLGVSGEGVRLWDVETGQELHYWKVDTHFERVAFVRGGKQAVAIDYYASVYYWDAVSGEAIRILRGPFTIFGAGPGTCEVTIFAAGRRAAAIYRNSFFSADNLFRLYDLEHGQLLYAGDIPTHMDITLAGAPDGRRLLTTMENGNLCLWELPATK